MNWTLFHRAMIHRLFFSGCNQVMRSDISCWKKIQTGSTKALPSAHTCTNLLVPRSEQKWSRTTGFPLKPTWYDWFLFFLLSYVVICYLHPNSHLSPSHQSINVFAPQSKTVPPWGASTGAGALGVGDKTGKGDQPGGYEASFVDRCSQPGYV